MAEVTKLKTFLNVVPITSWLTYTKAAQNDEVVVPEHGVSSIAVSTNGAEETWIYKTVDIATAIAAQDKGYITFGSEADAELFAVGGYVWNVTQGEIVLVRPVAADGVTVPMSRGLFGTPITTWTQNDNCLLMKVIVLTSQQVGPGLGEYTPMPDIGIGQDFVGA